MQTPDDDSPLVKLTNAALLSVLKQRPTVAWFGRGADGVDAVDFEFEVPFRDPIVRREMAPGAEICRRMVRRLAVMASIPFGEPDAYMRSAIVITIGPTRRATFGVHFDGHGDGRVARLYVLADGAGMADAQVRDWVRSEARTAEALRGVRRPPEPGSGQVS